MAKRPSQEAGLALTRIGDSGVAHGSVVCGWVATLFSALVGQKWGFGSVS